MRWLFVLVTGCWATSPAPPSTPPPTPHATCEVHDGFMVPAGDVVLAVHGIQFARVNGALGRLDVTVKGVEATASAENSSVSLQGELELDELPVRPTQIGLRAGWLEISHAIARRASDAAMEIEVPLPPGIDPPTITAQVPCGQLTFALPPPLPPTPHVEIVELAHGTTRLRATIEGKVVATAVVPRANDSGESIEAHVIERRDGWAHVRIPGPNTISVWVSAKALEEPSEGFGMGGFGKVVVSTGDATVTCTRAVPLYVSVKGKPLRVGTFKANVEARTRGPIANGRLGIELGGRDVAPYVDDLAACTVRSV